METHVFSTRPFTCNGRRYTPPAAPLVVICIDGCADDYLTAAIAHGRMPVVEAMAGEGFRGLVRGALPSFTNVNNAAIVTGAPPSETGICGNFFLDPESGEEVMMNSPNFLRCDNLLTAAAEAGRKVAFVTAKEKLRTLLGGDLIALGGIAVSSEFADEARIETHGVSDLGSIVGRPRPEIYSGDASIYVLEAGAALVESGRADFLYLSLTDYMQHRYAPEDPQSLGFYSRIDAQIGRMLESGCVVAATADHGMNDKTRPDGSPNVVYVEELLRDRFGPGARVICPITDPYVVHHGALGSLVMVHVDDGPLVPGMVKFLRGIEGIDEVYDRQDASRELELPADRIGDITVLSAPEYVLGKTEADHDLSVLEGGLRSHGGRGEEMVPLLLSRPLGASYRERVLAGARNFDVFDFACNGWDR